MPLHASECRSYPSIKDVTVDFSRHVMSLLFAVAVAVYGSRASLFHDPSSSTAVYSIPLRVALRLFVLLLRDHSISFKFNRDLTFCQLLCSTYFVPPCLALRAPPVTHI